MSGENPSLLTDVKRVLSALSFVLAPVFVGFFLLFNLQSNFYGRCESTERRGITSEFYIDAAVRHVLELEKTPQSSVRPVIKYDSVSDFRNSNTDCCAVAMHAPEHDWGYPDETTVLDKLMGRYVVYVDVVHRKFESGERPYAQRFVLIDSCGSIKWVSTEDSSDSNANFFSKRPVTHHGWTKKPLP